MSEYGFTSQTWIQYDDQVYASNVRKQYRLEIPYVIRVTAYAHYVDFPEEQRGGIVVELFQEPKNVSGWEFLPTQNPLYGAAWSKELPVFFPGIKRVFDDPDRVREILQVIADDVRNEEL